MMGRTLKGYVFTILTILAPVLLLAALVAVLHHFAPDAMMTWMIIVALCCMVLGLMTLPMLFVFMKYVMNTGKSYFSQLGASYARGLRHWGHIFTTMLISCLIVCVLAGICCLPTAILAQAHWASQEGFLNGDPLGMPGYITTLSFITYFLTGFILVYICMPILMIVYFMYGSIETYEQEKNKLDI
jgi:ABC-type Fe3+ transport system permease subunit